MTIDTVATPPASPRIDDWRRRDRVVGWVLLGALVALVVATVLTAHRASSYDRLQRLVASGEVTRVEVVGDPLPDDAIGHAGVELRWRDGLIIHTAAVVQASSRREVARASRSWRGATVLVGSVEDDLRRLDPDVSFTRGEHRSSSTIMLGVEAPSWTGLAWLALLGATLVVIGGRPPWRATRWGWGWLVLLVPPYGVAAYLLLGGPTGLLRPRDPGRVWLTGGWAFLLALLLGGGSSGS